MNYELAKKLRDKGFPYKKSLFGGFNGDSYITDKPSVINVPTLSELIEACGETFSSLTRSPRNTWYVAYVEKGGLVELARDIEESTPEEAVAALYLELNKKNG